MMALSLSVPSHQGWLAEKKNDTAVLDEILDILEEGPE
jgi:hypothetical protein